MSSLTPSNGLKNQAAFERLLAERFPAIAAAMDDIERGLLHVEMAVLARATCEAIDQGDTRTVCSHFNFIDELFACCAPDPENAIYVSYLENVFLSAQKIIAVSSLANCSLTACRMP